MNIINSLLSCVPRRTRLAKILISILKEISCRRKEPLGLSHFLGNVIKKYKKSDNKWLKKGNIKII